jgi:glycosyltransferase involved in cell wall biosynthesis
MKNTPAKPRQEERRVAIFQCYWSVQVHTLNLVDLLLESGWKVDLYLHSTGSQVGEVADLKETRKLLAVFELDGAAVMPDLGKKGSVKGLLQRIKWYLGKALYSSKAESVSYAVLEKSRGLFKQYEYDGVLAIEPMSLVWASQVCRRKKIPLVYYSLEVYTLADGRLPAESFKRQEKAEARYFKKVDGLIIQDAERADVLLNKYGMLDSPVIMYLPVSLKPHNNTTEKSFFLHDRLGLSHQTKIVLYVGVLTCNRFCTDLIDAADSFPDNHQLVIHTGSLPQTEYGHQVHEAALSKGIPVSTESLPFEEVPELFASSSIAVVLYTSDTPNNRLTGRASEKAAMAAQTGTPIIAMSSTSLGDVINEHHNGVAINNLQEFAAAVREIDRDQAGYIQGAIKSYDEIYNFDTHREKLVNFFDKVFSSRKYN